MANLFTNKKFDKEIPLIKEKFKKADNPLRFINSVVTGSAKWISKWRGHGTLKSIAGHHGWPTRENFEF